MTPSTAALAGALLARLALPVRVVVPSNSLRRHVAATVVRHRRRSVLGVQGGGVHNAPAVYDAGYQDGAVRRFG